MKTKVLIAVGGALASPAAAQTIEQQETLDPVDSCFSLDERVRTNEEEREWDTLDCEELLAIWSGEDFVEADDEELTLLLALEGGLMAELSTFGALSSRDSALCDSLPEQGRTAAQESQWETGLCDLYDDSLFGLFEGEMGDDQFGVLGYAGDVVVGSGTGGIGFGDGGGGGVIGLHSGALMDAHEAGPEVEVSLDSFDASPDFEEAGRELTEQALVGLPYCWSDSVERNGAFSVLLEVDEFGLVASVVVGGIEDELVNSCVEFEFLSLWHDTAFGFSVSAEASYAELERAEGLVPE
ncbi:MAG: hypothetical protein ACJAYU_005362 [Bradymonadia bacterium]|jgi:hypothetical protein